MRSVLSIICVICIAMMNTSATTYLHNGVVLSPEEVELFNTGQGNWLNSMQVTRSLGSADDFSVFRSVSSTSPDHTVSISINDAIYDEDYLYVNITINNPRIIVFNDASFAAIVNNWICRMDLRGVDARGLSRIDAVPCESSSTGWISFDLSGAQIQPPMRISFMIVYIGKDDNVKFVQT